MLNAAEIPLLPNESSTPIKLTSELVYINHSQRQIIDHFLPRYLSGKSALKQSRTISWKRLFLVLSGVENNDWEARALALQIQRYRNGFEYLIGLETITQIDLHKVNLMMMPDKVTQGLHRTSQNWIGKSLTKASYIPPTPESVPELFGNLIDYINDHTIEPISKAYIAHSQFLKIHPFRDGNGRVARLLWSVLADKVKEQAIPFHPLMYRLRKENNEYIQAIRSFGYENNTGLKHQFWHNSIEWGESYKKTFLTLFNATEQKLTNKLCLMVLSKEAKQLLQALWFQPVLHADNLPAKLSISIEAYHSSIYELANVGILVKRMLKIPQNDYIFECPDIVIFYMNITDKIFTSSTS